MKELTCLSNLPGLVKAGSRISGKFVAAISIMPCRKMSNAFRNTERNSSMLQHAEMYLILFKAIHLNEQLMQCFLCMAFPLFSCGPNSIYFIDENYTRSLWNMEPSKWHDQKQITKLHTYIRNVRAYQCTKKAYDIWQQEIPITL